MDIKINIKDNRNFTDVAAIVDRADFQKEIERIRLVLKIKVPLNETDFNSSFNIKAEKQIASEVDKSRKRLYLPVIFKRIIEAVAFRNEVNNDDYLPAYLDCKSDGTFDKDGKTPDETYFIVLSPGARDKDVIRAYQSYRDQLGNVGGTSNYDYIHRVWNTDISKPAIRKHREWYLAHEAGKSPKEIEDMEIESCPITVVHDIGKKKPKGCTCWTKSAITKGIESYEALIWKTRTF